MLIKVKQNLRWFGWQHHIVLWHIYGLNQASSLVSGPITGLDLRRPTPRPIITQHIYLDQSQASI